MLAGEPPRCLRKVVAFPRVSVCSMEMKSTTSSPMEATSRDRSSAPDAYIVPSPLLSVPVPAQGQYSKIPQRVPQEETRSRPSSTFTAAEKDRLHPRGPGRLRRLLDWLEADGVRVAPVISPAPASAASCARRDDATGNR